jgi:hypothetical protein
VLEIEHVNYGHRASESLVKLTRPFLSLSKQKPSVAEASRDAEDTGRVVSPGVAEEDDADAVNLFAILKPSKKVTDKKSLGTTKPVVKTSAPLGRPENKGTERGPSASLNKPNTAATGLGLHCASLPVGLPSNKV